MTTPRLVGSRYELGELIGYGGMAEVHRGRDGRLGRDVAIKLLRADLARDPSFLNRFRREAQSAAGLNHPAIVAVYDTGEDHSGLGPEAADVPYIVMEFVEGQTLRDVLKAEGRLPPRRAMEIVAEVCGALDFSHRNGIVHRDIKPANVMITRAGAVKVMDFGIARAIADNSATVTQTAAVIGTAQYLSPEQARGETVDARSDVYSTGCLLYELITGHPPFTGDSPVAVAYQHVREIPVVPSSENPAIPRALDSIVMKALAKNPLNRYQTAGEMRADLLRALADRPVEAEAVLTDAERTQYISKVPPGAVPPGAVVPMSADGDDEDDGDRKKRAWLWVALVAALLLVIGGAAWAIWALSGSGSPKKQAVPNIIGMNPAQANAAIASRKFTPPTGTPQPASKCGVNPDTQPIANPAEGAVCTQSPAPDTQQTEGTTITYTVYKAPTVQVPNVQGKQFADASNDLAGIGLKVARKDVPSGQDPGVVTDQDPKAFSTVAPGKVVTLSVSTGKLPIPDVRGQKYADAVSYLNNHGWSVNPTPVVVPTTDKSKDGTVADESPAAGTLFPQSQQITLSVFAFQPPPSPTPTPTPTPSPSSTPSSPSTSASSSKSQGGGGGNSATP
jgi:beta-lactam-binding protein with PASTA domain/predicted Ser/Thr protein kinase